MTTIANFTVEGPVGSGTAGGNPVLAGALDGSGNTVANKADASGNVLTSIASGVSIATVASSAPGASDAGLTVRNIPRKSSLVVLSTPLAANVSQASAWFDTQQSGTGWVRCEIYSDQNSAASGFTLQEADDYSNSNLIRNVLSTTYTGGTVSAFGGTVSARYWRINYTNGATPQTTFSITATEAVTPLYVTDSSGHLQVAQNGTWTVQQGSPPWTVTQTPSTSGGAALAKVLSGASTNATSLKSSAGQVYGYSFANNNAAFRYVHFYNKASAPTVGTDVPVFTVGIPPNFSAQVDFNSGTPFATGIAFSITSGASDTDTGATGANDVTGFILYK